MRISLHTKCNKFLKLTRILFIKCLLSPVLVKTWEESKNVNDLHFYQRHTITYLRISVLNSMVFLK